MAGTQIRGKQIKDDSITGDDVNEDTLIMKYFMTLKYTASTSDARYVRFNAGGCDPLGAVMSNNKFVAPSNGKLKHIVIRSTGEMGDTNISLMKITNGTPAFGSGNSSPFTEVSAEETRSVTVAEDDTSYVVQFSTNSFSTGNVLGIKVDPQYNHDNVDITAVWEFDWSS